MSKMEIIEEEEETEINPFEFDRVKHELRRRMENAFRECGIMDSDLTHEAAATAQIIFADIITEFSKEFDIGLKFDPAPVDIEALKAKLEEDDDL